MVQAQLAPLWAGLAIDTNEYLAGQGKPVLGSASAKLYSLYNTTQSFPAYHDITAGNNLFYAAGTGYDLASGIGTPDAWNIARDLAGSTGGTNDFSIGANPTSLTIAPGSSNTSTISTAVTSGSAGTVSLSTSVSPAGPTASLSSTSVTAGSTATLTVTVGSSVATGTYTVTVTGTEGSCLPQYICHGHRWLIQWRRRYHQWRLRDRRLHRLDYVWHDLDQQYCAFG